MKMPYFIMLINPNGEGAEPMMDSEKENEVAFYSTKDEAQEVCHDHSWAQAFGYEIFCLGNGE
jgi:hypothetical protein